MEDESNFPPKKSASKEILDKMREEDKKLIAEANRIIDKLKKNVEKRDNK